jgi:DhnA family fructose-bisphosphate aldolase class Ia
MEKITRAVTKVRRVHHRGGEGVAFGRRDFFKKQNYSGLCSAILLLLIAECEA